MTDGEKKTPTRRTAKAPITPQEPAPRQAMT